MVIFSRSFAWKVGGLSHPNLNMGGGIDPPYPPGSDAYGDRFFIKFFI